MNLVDKIKGFRALVSAKDISKKAVNLMMVPVAYFVIDKAINDYSPNSNVNSGSVYAAEAAVKPNTPYKGMPLELVMNSEEGAYLPDLTNFTERKDRVRKSDIIQSIDGKETTVKMYDNDDYRVRTFELPNGELYGFNIIDKKTGRKVYFTDKDKDKDRFFETKGMESDIDLVRYRIKG